MNNEQNEDFTEYKAKLLGSLLYFTKVFYEIRTGKKFSVVEPVSREARQVTICRELTKVLRGLSTFLQINIQPGAGKSELLIHFCAWSLAHFPDSNIMYVSYSKTLAEKHTHTIKQILEMPEYKRLFPDTCLRQDSTAKGDFKTTKGGAVYAAGSAGTITGINAGLPGIDRFSGCLILDDMHKPDEITSDTIREGVIRNYFETILPRRRSPGTPIIAIGQRLHEDDIFGLMNDGREGHKWDNVILRTMDSGGNNLCPDVISKEELVIKEQTSPYSYWSQYQQTPQPAGGGIFRRDWWPLLYEEPKMIATFIVADTAETAHTYNDATSFLFCGLYNIEQDGVDIGITGVHIIDCREIWVEPKDLENEFLAFYACCMRHPMKPMMAAIEKKSTGTTLISTMKSRQGLYVHQLEPSRATGSKISRFLEAQPYIASKRVSLLSFSEHTDMVLTHMSKITANDTHSRDDIADTIAYAIKIALIDKIVVTKDNTGKTSQVLQNYERATRQRMNASIKSWQ